MPLQRCQKAAQTLHAWRQGTRVQGRVRGPQAARAGSSLARGKSELYTAKKSEELEYFPPNILRVDFLHCFLWDSKHHQLIKLFPRYLTCPQSTAKCGLSSDLLLSRVQESLFPLRSHPYALSQVPRPPKKFS